MVPQIGATRGSCVFEHRFYADALDAVAVDQLVVDRKSGLSWEVVRRVEGGEEVVAVAGLVLEPGEHFEDAGWVGDQRRLGAVERGGEDGSGVLAVDFTPDQLESGGV